MKKISTAVSNFVQEEDGLTTVEYAVAGALVAGALVAAFTQLGAKVGEVLQGIKGILVVPT